MMKRKRSKISHNSQSRKLRKSDIIGISVAGVFLLLLWALCIGNLIQGDYFGYKNYFGQPIGTFLLLAFLIIATPINIIMIIKTVKSRRVRLSSTPKWMNTPPWKFPWEGD